MNIENAKTLKVGSYVQFPPDRGRTGGTGRVVSVARNVCTNSLGSEYLWVTIVYNGHQSVWPSNRLS